MSAFLTLFLLRLCLLYFFQLNNTKKAKTTTPVPFPNTRTQPPRPPCAQRLFLTERTITTTQHVFPKLLQHNLRGLRGSFFKFYSIFFCIATPNIKDTIHYLQELQKLFQGNMENWCDNFVKGFRFSSVGFFLILTILYWFSNF